LPRTSARRARLPNVALACSRVVSARTRAGKGGQRYWAICRNRPTTLTTYFLINVLLIKPYLINATGRHHGHNMKLGARFYAQSVAQNTRNRSKPLRRSLTATLCVSLAHTSHPPQCGMVRSLRYRVRPRHAMSLLQYGITPIDSAKTDDTMQFYGENKL